MLIQLASTEHYCHSFTVADEWVVLRLSILIHGSVASIESIEIYLCNVVYLGNLEV